MCTYHEKTFVDVNATDKYGHVVGPAIFELWNDLHTVLVFVGLKIGQKTRITLIKNVSLAKLMLEWFTIAEIARTLVTLDEIKYLL